MAYEIHPLKTAAMIHNNGSLKSPVFTLPVKIPVFLFFVSFFFNIFSFFIFVLPARVGNEVMYKS